MKLPRVSGLDTIKVFVQIGHAITRRQGSHVVLCKEGMQHLSVPNHRELDRGTLRKLIRQAGMEVDEFVARFK